MHRRMYLCFMFSTNKITELHLLHLTTKVHSSSVHWIQGMQTMHFRWVLVDFPLHLPEKQIRLCTCMMLGFKIYPAAFVRRSVIWIQLKGATSWLAYLEKLSLNFSSSSFVIRVNLLHPCFFKVYSYLLGAFLSQWTFIFRFPSN